MGGPGSIGPGSWAHLEPKIQKVDFLGEKKPLREHPQANKALKFQKVDSLGEKKPLRAVTRQTKLIYNNTIICLCPENMSVYVQKIKAFVSCLDMMEFVIYKEKLENCVFTKN